MDPIREGDTLRDADPIRPGRPDRAWAQAML